MSADLIALSAPESAALVQCEAVIRQGLESFVTVGTALCRIRDERLYRATHTNFQAYCEITWGFGREYAHRLIGAANVVGMLPIGNTITNEAQARELARVAPEQRAEVLERAGPNPTAKAIREAATPPQSAPAPITIVAGSDAPKGKPEADDGKPERPPADRSFFDLPPERRHALCAAYWDMLQSRTLILSAVGKTVVQIAEMVAMPEEDVSAIISPRRHIPQDFLLVQILTPIGNDIYDLSLQTALLRMQSNGLFMAAACCEADGYAAAKNILEAQRLAVESELRVVESALQEISCEERFDNAIAQTTCAVARAAFRISTAEKHASEAFCAAYGERRQTRREAGGQ